MSLHPEEEPSYVTLEDMSGRTVSSLDSFMRKMTTADNLGNTLPGYYEPDTNSSVVQPPEGTMLDLMYEIGANANSYVVGGDNGAENNTYQGDVLYSVRIFHRDEDGEELQQTARECFEGDDVISMIESSNAEAELIDDATDVIYADFKYYLGCTYVYASAKIAPTDTEHAIECVDHCILEESTWPYYLSQEESYTVRYYNVVKDKVETYSDDYQMETSVYMCDFTFRPSKFGVNSGVVSPVFRKEELLGFSSPEKYGEDIYIDRGYATVLDRHLRLGEVSSYEQLERYGNGIFTMFNVNEDTV